MGIAIQDVDLNDIGDFDDVDAGGLPAAGRYHVRLIDVEEQDDGEHTPSSNLTFQILAGTTSGQRGKKVMERIYHPSSDLESMNDADKKKEVSKARRALGIAKRMDIYTAADLKDGKEVDFSEAIGREFIIDLKEETYQGKKSIRMDYMGIWTVGHPDVMDCPLGGGKKQPTGAAAGGAKTPAANGNAKPAAAARRQTAPAAKAADTDTI